MSVPFRIGIDVEEVSRVKKLARNPRFLKKVFSKDELQYCHRKRNQAQHFAVRFAAKEAFLKALGLGLREGITWHDMSVARDDLGKPSLVLTGAAALICRTRGVGRVHLSYSHDGDYAQAVVILEEQ